MSGSINAPNNKIDQTVKIFDQFYEFALEVDANTYDTVNSYFISVFADTQIAKNFTVTLFRVASQTGVSVLVLLQQIQGLNSIELTNTLCYYLNGLRSPATLLGINATITPNYWTARNVLL